jgi:Na+/H+ antiporter NhaC
MAENTNTDTIVHSEAGKKKINVITLIAFCIVILILIIAAATQTKDSVQNTAWSLLPPLIAIVLALVTKEVYSSLFIGIVSGALLYSHFSFAGTTNHVFKKGLLAVLCDSYNMGILIFLVILGVMVALMNKAGGSRAFGQWAAGHIKTRTGAQFATIVLGILIFIDDYFNCLTVGSVMRPVTDGHRVSRAKLAYLIDATAAPVCIIAPISSWAAAVSGLVKGHNGFTVFVQCIPYNFYALLTIIFMFILVGTKTEYGAMTLHERNAILNNDLYTTPDRPYANAADDEDIKDGKVIDMILPIVVLIVCCVIGMLYTGDFFKGKGVIEAFSNSDASVGLAYGSFFALVFTLILYLARRLMTFEEFMNCVPEGFKAMVAPILILTFAWSLKAMTTSLGSEAFVNHFVKTNASHFMSLLPAIVFLLACLLSFATGTSWGTFGILIPIVVAVFQGGDYQLMIIAVSACMAGSVCGDHCSPISDTTIMASAGAQCNHINHVSTQLYYAMTVAVISLISYVIAGFTRSWIPSLIAGVLLIILVMFGMKKVNPNDDLRNAEAAVKDAAPTA